MRNYLKDLAVGLLSLKNPENTWTIGGTEYTGVKKVNTGHVGVVYKAFDPNGDVVAIKKTYVETWTPFNRFYRYMKKALRTEMETLRKVTKSAGHENVMRFIDGKVSSSSWSEDYPYVKSLLVTEFCENGDVLDYMEDLKKKKRGVPELDENRVRSYLNQMANGLKYIQSKGINYSGIKPANLLLTDNYKTLKICDFGYAINRGLFGSTRRRDPVGCRRFLAPEVMDHLFSYDERATIWSIGLTMYEMLYRELPAIPEHIDQQERLEITFPKRRRGEKEVTSEMKLFLTNCIQPVKFRMGFKELYKTIDQDLQPWEDL